MVRARDRKSAVRTFSGGMSAGARSRAVSSHPLDVPSRRAYYRSPTPGRAPYLDTARLREAEDLTIFLTTQYLDEAEFANRIAIIDTGKIVALDTPDGLKRSIGGDLITFSTPDMEAGLAAVKERYGVEALARDGSIRFHIAQGDSFLPEFIRSFPQPIETVSLATDLEDVYDADRSRDPDAGSTQAAAPANAGRSDGEGVVRGSSEGTWASLPQSCSGSKERPRIVSSLASR